MERDTVLSGQARQVTRAAALISLGNVASRTLGLVREMVKSYFFGAGGAVSAFDVAAQVPTMLYDLLTGGMLSSALVPVFSDYARPEKRAALWQLLSLLLSLLAIFLGTFILLIEIAAPTVAHLLSAGLDPEYLALATQMIRITTPAILFLNVAGLLSGALYALQRFERPAFIAAVSNATLVAIVVLLGRTALGPHSLAVGLLAGSLAQVLLQLPALRGARLRLVNPFQGHPALPAIGRLYLPIGLGLIVDQAAVALSYNLASRTGPSGIAWMKYAATLIQFPLGMVVTAVSVAILPTLSRYATDAEEDFFSATLAQGLRMVLILVLPATVAMLALTHPVVALIFQRGHFTAEDTLATALALRYSLLGLVFAALDQPLIFAFYARKNTWTPAVVGAATVALYTLLALAPTWLHAPRLDELILANSLKLAAHALLMLYLYSRMVRSLRPYGVGRTTLIALLASLIMALPLVGTSNLLADLRGQLGPYLLGLGTTGQLLSHWVGGTPGLLLQIAVAGSVGMICYLWIIQKLGMEEITLLQNLIVRRWKSLWRR